jgi:hypothetical protein
MKWRKIWERQKRWNKMDGKIRNQENNTWYIYEVQMILWLHYSSTKTYEGRGKSSWTGGSAPLLCKVVVVGCNIVVVWSSSL